MCIAGGLRATGYYGPDVYLDDGGKNVGGSPEFYWGLEVRRICREFHPPEKLVLPKEAETKNDEEEKVDTSPQDTQAADLKDFDDALKQGRIKPRDSEKAKQDHKAARDAI